MKKLLLIYFVVFLFCRPARALSEDERHEELLEKEYSVNVVVIDPGHGGNDVGAISKKGLYEKNITIKIAKKLKSLIENKLKIKVFLTRNSDEYVSLRNRTKYANDNNADLFISIHANSSKYVSISGCETFFFKKDASDEQARLLAELENKGELSKDNEPVNPLEFILMDMAKSEFIELSYKFADIIQKEYSVKVKSHDRGVKQAPFMVLMGAKMPAVLTEIGFLSSKRDENRLQSEKYLGNIAASLFESIANYKEMTDSKNGKITKITE